MISGKQKILLIILIIAVLVSLNKFVRAPVKNAFYVLTSPVSKIFWQSGQVFSETLATLFEIKTLKNQNQLLLAQNFKLIREINELRALGEENEALREILRLELNKKFDLILAEVVAEETDQDFILISKGDNFQIKENMVVITVDGVLVGSIEKVSPNFSKVRLITARNSVFDVLINGKLALAKGQGNLRLALQLVPKENQIELGDAVLTTSFGGTFPEGLLVGEIRDIQRVDVEPYDRGEISPFFTQGQLKFLLVIKNFIPPR